MADFGEIVINTTAEKIERMANMEINNEVIDDTSDDNSLPTSKLVYDFVSNSASGGSGDYVSYSQSQNLTNEQKQTARENINAVDASKIINAENYSGALNDSVYDKSAIQQFALINTVTVSPNQTLSDRKKQIGRQNIDVDGGKWEPLFTIEGDGETIIWEYTETPDGTPIQLEAVAITVTQTVAEAANGYGQLYGYYSADNQNYNKVNVTTISQMLSSTILNGQALAVIEPNKGFYEAYSVSMKSGNPDNLMYSGFYQFMASTSDNPYINKIKIVAQRPMSVGNTFTVWGVRWHE